MTPTTSRTTTPHTHLTPRDLAVFLSEGHYGYLTTRQLHRLHFTTDNERTVNNRLTALARSGFHERIFAYPRATGRDTGRPSAVYFQTPTTLSTIKRTLESEGRAHAFTPLADIYTVDRHDRNRGIAHNTIGHEVAISEFFITMTEATAASPNTLHFWERTSPTNHEVQDRFEDVSLGTAQSEKRWRALTFNPDALFLYHTADGLCFRFFELDNNTTTSIERIQRKLAGYVAYRAHRRLAHLITHYRDKYLLPLTDRSITDFRVLTVAPDAHRRNQLLEQACKLVDRHLFYFAAMTDLTPATILSPVWISASDWRTLYDEQRRLPPSVKRSVKLQWITERSATLPHISLTD